MDSVLSKNVSSEINKSVLSKNVSSENNKSVLSKNVSSENNKDYKNNIKTEHSNYHKSNPPKCGSSYYKEEESKNNNSIFKNYNLNENKISTIKEKEKEHEHIIEKGGFSIVSKSTITIEIAKKKIKEKALFEKEEFYLKLLNKSEIKNNIVKYYKSDDKNNILYLELCEGNLKHLRKKIIKKYNNTFPLFIIQDIMNQINNVMKYLILKLKLVYNDMKPENILFLTINENNDLYEIKLCDFNLVEENIKKNGISKEVSGTYKYMDDEKKNEYEKDIHLYDQVLQEIYSLGNIMYYLYYGKAFDKEDRNEIKKIEDKDFKYILKNTLTNDADKMPINEYFNAKFFYKDKKDLKDGIKQNEFELSMKDAEEIARKVNKIKDPKILDFDSNVINEKISSNVKHFASFNENNVFNLVCYNDKENQIEFIKKIN